MDETQQADQFSRILKRDFWIGASPTLIEEDHLERVQAFLNVANEQYQSQSDKSRGKIMGQMIYALARYSAWSVECHSSTRDDLESVKALVIDQLTQAFKQQLEEQIDLCVSNFTPPDVPANEWRSRFSVTRLEQTLDMACPEALRPIYAAFHDGTLDEVTLDISKQVRLWNCQSPFTFHCRDFDARSSFNSVHEASSRLGKGWCFALSKVTQDYWPDLCVEQDGTVSLYMEDKFVTRVADTLEDLFEVDLSRIAERKLHLVGKFQAPTIEEVVGAEHFYWGDQEIVDNPKDYEWFIERAFVATSGGILKLDAFAAGFAENGDNWLRLTLNGREFEFTLPDQHGWVEPSIVDRFNDILPELVTTQNRYMSVRDADWGQEFGVVFAEPRLLERLKQLRYDEG